MSINLPLLSNSKSLFITIPFSIVYADYPIPCFSSSRHEVYAIPSDKDINDLPILSRTKMYSVPSVPDDIWDSSFELTWSEPAKCGRCERKGKKCRFQNNSTDLKTECIPNKGVVLFLPNFHFYNHTSSVS